MTWSGTAFNIPPKKVERHFRKDFGSDGPIALLLLDMDLYEPTIAAPAGAEVELGLGQ